jgi:Tol biopolymer transport system component
MKRKLYWFLLILYFMIDCLQSGYDRIPVEPQKTKGAEKIVFVSDRDGNGEIYSMKTDGSEQTNLTKSQGNDRALIFQP